VEEGINMRRRGGGVGYFQWKFMFNELNMARMVEPTVVGIIAFIGGFG
jgi:hypothetical protein